MFYMRDTNEQTPRLKNILSNPARASATCCEAEASTVPDSIQQIDPNTSHDNLHREASELFLNNAQRNQTNLIATRNSLPKHNSSAWITQSPGTQRRIRAVNDSTTAIATCKLAKQFDGRTQPHTCSRNVGHNLVEGGHERFANEEGVITQLTKNFPVIMCRRLPKTKQMNSMSWLRAFLRGTALFFAPKPPADHSTYRRHRRDTMYPRSFTLTTSRTLNFATSCC